ncbi:MAG: N-acetyltransferase [Pseudomonadota bacterium]
MAGRVTVEPVTGPADTEAFIRFPFALYRGYPHWVPPLLTERRDFLNARKNPVFEYAAVQPFLARREGRVVGTIAAIRNDRFREFHPDEKDVGFFGLYESENDPDTSRALLSAAAEWLSREGLRTMRGPANLTTNDVLGLLVEGFDEDPALLMPYNPPYYAAQFESFGLAKVKDLYAFDVASGAYREQLDRTVGEILKRGHVKLRPVNLKRWTEEIAFVRRCYNEAWAKNWGFVPWTDREMETIARELKPLVDPRLAFVGEVNGEPAGIVIAVPDANEALKLAKGKLFPFGLLKLLWKVKVSRCSRLRVMALGILPKYRRLGIHAVFIHRIIEDGIRIGYPHAEVGWILEDNEAMLRPLRHVDARRTKVYRVYDRRL